VLVLFFVKHRVTELNLRQSAESAGNVYFFSPADRADYRRFNSVVSTDHPVKNQVLTDSRVPELT
jgi:hypothetical protein